MKEYMKEWIGLMAVAIFIAVFIVGFKPLMKVFVATVPMPDGARELLAA